MKKLKIFSTMFLIGGVGYNIIEILWRGYTHFSMFIAGGLCFNAFAAIGKKFKNHSKLTLSVLGALTVTTVEFITGCIVNIWLKKNVWNYSGRRFNLLGQICPMFTFFWAILSCFFIPFAKRMSTALNKLYNCNNDENIV